MGDCQTVTEHTNCALQRHSQVITFLTSIVPDVHCIIAPNIYYVPYTLLSLRIAFLIHCFPYSLLSLRIAFLMHCFPYALLSLHIAFLTDCFPYALLSLRSICITFLTSEICIVFLTFEICTSLTSASISIHYFPYLLSLFPYCMHYRSPTHMAILTVNGLCMFPLPHISSIDRYIGRAVALSGGDKLSSLNKSIYTYTTHLVRILSLRPYYSY